MWMGIQIRTIGPSDCHFPRVQVTGDGGQIHGTRRLQFKSAIPVRRDVNQKPDSMRWNTMSVKVEICAPTKGAETATVTRMATILGTKVRVIS
jgi:hypothetical protein